MEPLKAMSDERFRPLIEAASPTQKVILESNANLDTFRVEGLPFRSKKLTDFLKSLKAQF